MGSYSAERGMIVVLIAAFSEMVGISGVPPLFTHTAHLLKLFLVSLLSLRSLAKSWGQI